MSFDQMRQNSSSLAKDIGYVCRKKGDVCNPKHTVLTPNYGDAAASVEVGKLIMVDEIMKKEGNVKILTEKLMQSIVKVVLGCCFVFQPDKEPNHI